MGAVLAVLEERDGKLRSVALEVLTAARQLAAAGKVDAVRISPKSGHAAAIAERAKSGPYAAIVLAATAQGRDLGPRIAARLGIPLLADVTALSHDQGIVATRPVYSGKALSRVRVTAPSCVISVRPNAFAAADGADAADALPEPSGPARTVEIKAPEKAALDVAEATIVISGGRGLKEPANFKLLEDLAAAFGNAAVGASRAVVDAGWRPHADQVGQTGKTVSPGLYFAIGISGAIQHLAGMRTAKVIVAINRDKDAPIFKVADYGVVGDLFEIVPRLTQEIRKLRSS